MIHVTAIHKNSVEYVDHDGQAKVHAIEPDDRKYFSLGDMDIKETISQYLLWCWSVDYDNDGSCIGYYDVCLPSDNE